MTGSQISNLSIDPNHRKRVFGLRRTTPARQCTHHKDGVVTAANVSGICDGAGSVIVASEQAVKDYNLEPLATVCSHGITGCQPTIMGLGPVEAIRQALQRSNLTLDDVDRVEINEAFAWTWT